MNKFYNAAVEYAENGIKVFPLVPKQKIPLTKNGVKDATTNLDQIRRWWMHNPDANVGIAMGESIFGLDIDYKDGADPKFLGRIPKTVIAKSPNGGHHAYFKTPKGGIKNGHVIEKGVTIRALGYYFVAPPSVFGGNFYGWEGNGLGDGEIQECPEWIDESSKKATEEKKKFTLPEVIPKGEQHTDLFKFGCSLRAGGMGYEEILIAFVTANNRLQEPAPIENLEKLAKDIVDRYLTNDQKREIQNKENVKTDFEVIEQIDKKLEEQKEEISDSVTGEIKENNFPIHCLGGVLSETVSVISEKTSAPVEMVANSILAGVALCVQEHFNIRAFGSIRPISCYFVTIADSGERKSSVDSLALRAHYKWRDQKHKEYETKKAEYKTAMDEYKNSNNKSFKAPKPLSPKAPVLFASEPTIEGLFFCLKFHRNSVGLFTDEGGTWLGGHSMKSENIRGTLAKLNSLWDGKPIDRIRRGSDDGEVDMLFNKRVSSHLMVQSKLAGELFGNEYAKSQGYLARCLVCRPKSMVGKRKFLWEVNIDKEVEKYYSTVGYFLNKVTVDPVVLEPGNGVVELIEAFYTEIEPLQESEKELAFVREFASKLPEHCIRLAAILQAFSNPDASLISAEWMKNAIEIGRFYLRNHCVTTQASADIRYSERDKEALFHLLMKRDSWALRDLMRVGPVKLRHKKELVKELTELSKKGILSYNEETKVVTITK